MASDRHIYPPNDIHKERILAVIVEKSADTNGTSMRQKELFAYSSEIIIRDGYMVMPKGCWKEFNLGEWVSCEREFAKNRYNKEVHERELVDVQRVSPEEYKRLKIMPTRVANEQVQVMCNFVMCPDFIEFPTRGEGRYDSYVKVIMLYFGQAFIRRTNYKMVAHCKPDRVYRGIFEFRSKTNGGVNFSSRNGEKDSTGHFVERDALWELMDIVDLVDADQSANNVAVNSMRICEDKEMSSYLKNLERSAEKFSDKRAAARNPSGTAPARQAPPAKLNKSIESNSSGSTLKTGKQTSADTSLKIRDETSKNRGAPVRTAPRPNRQPIHERSAGTRGEILEHRKSVIKPYSVYENSSILHKYIDIETREVHENAEFLERKFNIRYGLSNALEPALSTEVVRRSGNLMMENIDPSPYDVPRDTSTPLPSPMVDDRRQMGNQNPNFRFDMSGINESLESIVRDNNANPQRTRRPYN